MHAILFGCRLCQETSGHRAFEIKRQLVADVAADNEKGCRDTLDWAKKAPWQESCHAQAPRTSDSAPRLGTCRALPEDAESVLRVLNDCEKPLLHKAAAQGNSDMLQLGFLHFFAAGSKDPSISSSNDEAPLLPRQLFLEHRADVNLQAKETQRTALHEAREERRALGTSEHRKSRRRWTRATLARPGPSSPRVLEKTSRMHGGRRP